MATMPKVYPQEFGDTVVPAVLGRGKRSGATQFAEECRVLRSKAGYLSHAKLPLEGAIFKVSDTLTRTR